MKDKDLIHDIRARNRNLQRMLQHLALNLREPTTGESPDFQAKQADKILDLMEYQVRDIERMYTQIHGGGTGKD